VDPTKPVRPTSEKSGWAIAALIVTVVALLARVRTFGNPVLGFDEQFYLLVGERMWHGVLPYVDVFDRKPVGLFLIYAAAACPGGDAFIAYKLLALASVICTALLVFRMARWSAGRPASLVAALLYVLWLDLLEGEGGQAPVFYALPMIAAAAIIGGAMRRAGSPRRHGLAAMLLVGVALQIKYSVVVEGIAFGCALIVAAWRSGERGVRLVGSTASWIAAALLPTLAASAYYAARGHADEFLFANFLSVLGQGRGDAATQAGGAAVMVAILAPLAAILASGWRGRSAATDASTAFLLAWLGAAVLGVVAYWRFASPHYAMPILLPMLILLAPVIDASRARLRIAQGLAVLAFFGGQAVMAISERQKGGAEQVFEVARAAQARDGCIYVYDGYPALYMLTRSCLPTRWVFPGHLNTREEAGSAALGVDPTAEVERILATRPVAIVDDFPRFAGGNPATHAVLQRTLDAEYALAACVPTGSTRVRLVYRLRSEGRPRPTRCPDPAALRAGHP